MKDFIIIFHINMDLQSNTLTSKLIKGYFK